jgi:hypothetical protein
MSTSSNAIFDLAVLGKSTFAVSPICDNHTVFLTPEPLSATVFTNLFFNNNSFCISTASSTVEYITFADQTISMATVGYYPMTGQSLDLYECIYEYALYDLNLSDSSISPIAKVELRKELSYLTLSSLDIISSTRLSVIVGEIVSGSTFIVSVVFSNKNSCVKPVIVKFQYKII